MELVPTTQKTGVGGCARVGPLHLLQVVDVLDLGVRADPVVIAAEVGLAVGEKDRLVLRAAQGRNGEIPPLREQQGGDKDDERDRKVALETPALDDPADRAAVSAAKSSQRVGLGVTLGRAVEGAAVGVAGGAVATGSWPDLNFLINVTTSPSSRRFSMKST